MTATALSYIFIEYIRRTRWAHTHSSEKQTTKQQQQEKKTWMTMETFVHCDVLSCSYPVRRTQWMCSLVSFHFIIALIIIFSSMYWIRVRERQPAKERRRKTTAFFHVIFSFFRVGQFVFEFIMHTAKCRASKWKWQRRKERDRVRRREGERVRGWEGEKEKKVFGARWEDKSLRAEWDKVSGECDANVDKKKIYEMAFKLFLYIWLN